MGGCVWCTGRDGILSTSTPYPRLSLLFGLGHQPSSHTQSAFGLVLLSRKFSDRLLLVVCELFLPSTYLCYRDFRFVMRGMFLSSIRKLKRIFRSNHSSDNDHDCNLTRSISIVLSRSRMYLYSFGPSWYPDRKSVLGVVLLGGKFVDLVASFGSNLLAEWYPPSHNTISLFVIPAAWNRSGWHHAF